MEAHAVIDRGRLTSYATEIFRMLIGLPLISALHVRLKILVTSLDYVLYTLKKVFHIVLWIIRFNLRLPIFRLWHINKLYIDNRQFNFFAVVVPLN